MTGKELIEFITEHHLEEKPVMVFSSEKWTWVEALKAFSHGEATKLDARYLTDEHVESLRIK